MFKQFCGALLILVLSSASIASAQGRGGGVVPGRPNIGNRPDYDSLGEGGVVQQYPPHPMSTADAEKYEEKRRAEEKVAKDKSLNAHADPNGGFFDANQSPKDMFAK